MNNPAEQFAAANKPTWKPSKAPSARPSPVLKSWSNSTWPPPRLPWASPSAHAKAVLAVKTPQEFMSLQTAFFQPMAEKSAAYFQHVQSIATEGSAEHHQAVRSQRGRRPEGLRRFDGAADQERPAGSEAAVAAFQNAVTQSQKAVEQTQAAIKKATAQAQANFAAASKQTTDMVKKAAKV
jgi:hypothetical protein